MASWAEHAIWWAVLLTVGGVPSIHYGDEPGFRGVKEQRAGGDDPALVPGHSWVILSA